MTAAAPQEPSCRQHGPLQLAAKTSTGPETVTAVVPQGPSRRHGPLQQAAKASTGPQAVIAAAPQGPSRSQHVPLLLATSVMTGSQPVILTQLAKLFPDPGS